ncbi:putative hydrolase [Nostocoides japonicum T1-X7]|uniref:Putative hydrolase n=1 Tax=Nostocoides japonicum T1-X7 TaxID=1194083 RepID=A0A077LXA0_9MICO|nr:dienelactone hydrolase family protein [Tetrasphaera japonica]CCH76609.1 putative hydrolase [Tetrasphaera japonica T1-X7]
METTTIDCPDGTAEAWLALPAYAVGPVPGVLFLMDAYGLRPQIATMMERIASWGYAVLAPNLLYRSGSVAEVAPTVDLREPGRRDEVFAQVRPRLAALTPERAAGDHAAYVAALRDLPQVAASGIGLTGYCMGARHALGLACAHPGDVAAVGGWHGGGLATTEPDSPHRGLGSARAAFAFGHAEGDRSMPPEAVERLGAALSEAALTFSNEVFPGPHGYTMADTSAYSPEADALHWERLEALFAAHLR